MMRKTLTALLWATPLWADPLSHSDYTAMAQSDIVILGEIHDNAAHHDGQALILAQLTPKAVVFEMLSPAQAQTVNNSAYADMHELGEMLNWSDSGWPDFSLYAPLFRTLTSAHVVGAALPREQVRAAFDQGAATPFGPDASDFGLDLPLPKAEQAQREKKQFHAHCAAMPEEMMGGMVEAQRLRDGHFARVTLEALKTYGAPVVVIAGNGHARRDWGMPAVITHAAPALRVFALGFVEIPDTSDDPRFDRTIPTAPTIRPDPCDAFKKS